MMKLKHLRHPLRTANAAKALVAARWEMKRFADRGERHFRGDVRYDLQNVTDGFASRIDDSSADAELLERICTAYIKAVKQQQFAPEAYKVTGWWEQVRQGSLAPVMQALRQRDLDALGRMYRNFFRDSCAAGLIGVPYGMSKAYFGGTMKDIHRRVYLSDALYRIDYWIKQTDGRFALPDLADPRIGNPFGVLLDGTLVRTGAEYQHYCAQRLGSLLDSETANVVEIGGGFGGMAYYLLRDRANVTYLDFDVPESIALTSYYLLKAFPQRTFQLYGEKELTKDTIAQADIVLMPVFELAKMPPGSSSITFSSHAILDISHPAMVEYLNRIVRMTQDYFLYVGNNRAGELMFNSISRSHDSLRQVETRSSGWNSHKISGASAIECLYRIGRI